MLDAPIASGANMFIWGFAIVLGVVHALIALDVISMKEKDEEKA
ncbi:MULTISPECIES: hypothetical protein [Persicobacter]|uniref:Uncharacterized protein n=1 Tax=Persicobacter diffluens TaxID=981 RepID=A0AAN4VYM4_9BACT|nr:hypothetical protein [Persicobacter sp. CCB-QB2]GJM62153.1 hypothetical protein PEDI_27050 [Persicobacter diffluens]